MKCLDDTALNKVQAIPSRKVFRFGVIVKKFIHNIKQLFLLKQAKPSVYSDGNCK